MNPQANDGASKPSDQCGGPAIFSRRTHVNVMAAVNKHGMRDSKAPDPDIVPAWTCSKCGYVETLGVS